MAKLTQEIFAVGKWNGIPFNLNDLKTMAKSFHKLKSNLNVPLKMGHNDEQPLTDGQPALGWVTDMFVDESSSPAKLVAEFDDVPDIVFTAFSKKLYRTVSIELDFGVTYKGSYYDLVVTAVALLGADLPAVNVLNDLGAYMSKRRNSDGIRFGRRVNFSLSTKELSGGRNVELEEALAALEAEKKRNQTLAAENSTLTQFKVKSEEDAKKAKILAVDQKRKDVKAVFEKAVTDKVITPAQRESFAKLFRIDNDDAIEALDIDDVKEAIGVKDGTATFTKKDEGEQGMVISSEKKKGFTVEDLPEGKAVDAMMVDLTNEYMAEHNMESKDFSKALNQVMRLNPELARAYHCATDPIEA